MINRDEKEMSIQEIVHDMKIGWNLGNSLEAPAPDYLGALLIDYETSWGNPKTTKKMIQEVINAGFNTIRIPVTWGKLMGKGPEYRIVSEWMDRVQEVVDYAYYEGVYVILNIHHEDQWLYLGNVDAERNAVEILDKLWKQIARRFQTYDYHLMFETMNETRLIGNADEWTAGTAEARRTINRFNETAVRAIRSAGQGNVDRPIIIKSIGARYNVEAIRDVVVPDNDRRILLSIHVYEPYQFCMVSGQTAQWGTREERKELSKLINDASAAAQEKGIPIIIGEFGTINKNNEDVRAEYTAYFVQEAKKRGITCILWDNNIEENEYGYSIFNREKLTWRFPRILRAVIENS
mgnify:FL=1